MVKTEGQNKKGNLGLENLLKTVKECIKRKGGLHGRPLNETDDDIWYCKLSEYGRDGFCPYLGYRTVTRQESEKGFRYIAVYTCKLRTNEKV